MVMIERVHIGEKKKICQNSNNGRNESLGIYPLRYGVETFKSRTDLNI